MRLIDIEDEELLKTVSLGNMSMKKLWKRIRSEREIEAIPIAWLFKWENEHTQEYETYFREIGKYPIECAIEDWRKESEDKE